MKAIFVAFAIFAVYLYTASSQRVECPRDWSGINLHFIKVPNPCNCSAYFFCLRDIVVPMPCPPTLQFNSATQQCDCPCKAHCKVDPNC